MTPMRLLPPGLIDAAAQIVRRRTGLAFGPSRMGAFQTGFTKALAAMPGATPESYLARLDTDPSAMDDLVAEITVGETYFLREPEQCAVIRDRILPTLFSQRERQQPLRVWSAGCATGEEAYSLAMLLREAGSDSAQIVGTDLSRVALARARRGHYTKWSLRGVPEVVVQNCFLKQGDRFILNPAVREAVEFQFLNLAEDVYPSLFSGIWGMDLILCRNVLIYFDAETIARVARRLIDSLSTDGWLLLGSSDPSLAGLVPCEVVLTSAGLAYRRVGAANPSFVFPHQLPEPASEKPSFIPLDPDDLDEVAPLAPLPTPGATSSEDPDDATPALDAAHFFAERDYERAAALAAQGVAQDADALPLWILWVRALANLGQLEDAGRACGAGIERHSTSAELTYLHAVLLAEMSHFDAASQAARRALYLDRNFIVAHLALARALTRLADTNGARRSLENAGRLLAALAPDAIVPASDGEPAGRLFAMARVQLGLLSEEAA